MWHATHHRSISTPEQLAKDRKNTYLQSPTTASSLTVIRYTNNGPWVFCVPVEINNFISAFIFEAKKIYIA